MTNQGQHSPEELKAQLDTLREELRLTMLDQPTSGKRETFNDGFASALSYAIGKIDALDTRTPSPAVDEKLVEKVARGMCEEDGLFAPDDVAEEWSDGTLILRWQTFKDDAEQAVRLVRRAAMGSALPDKLIEALTDARAAIASLPEDALGMDDRQNYLNDPQPPHPIRDELLSKIDEALRSHVSDGGVSA